MNKKVDRDAIGRIDLLVYKMCERIGETANAGIWDLVKDDIWELCKASKKYNISKKRMNGIREVIRYASGNKV